MLIALQRDAKPTLDFLQEINSDLLKDRDFMLIALQRDAKPTLDFLQEINSDLLKDRDFMLIALSHTLNNFFDDDQMSCFNCYLKNSKSNPTALRGFLSGIEAVFRDRFLKILTFPQSTISEFLKDRVFILKLLANIKHSNLNISHIIEKVLTSEILEIIGTQSELLNDRDFMIELLHRDGPSVMYWLQKANSKLLDDRDFMIEALPYDTFYTFGYLKKINSRFLSDRDFVLNALDQDIRALEDADKSLKNDDLFRRGVINRSIGQAYKYGYIGIFGVIGYSILKAAQWIKNLFLWSFNRHRPKKDH
jgi:hypothetical protein